MVFTKAYGKLKIQRIDQLKHEIARLYIEELHLLCWKIAGAQSVVQNKMAPRFSYTACNQASR